jgi:hypothetical protein
MKALILTLSFFLCIFSLFNFIAANAHIDLFGLNPTSPKEALVYLLVSFVVFLINYFSIKYNILFNS